MTLPPEPAAVPRPGSEIHGSMPTLSIVVPAFNEADNIPLLHARLAATLQRLVPDAWEVDEAQAAQYRRALELRLREFVGDTGKHPVHFAVTEAANHGHGIAEYARRVHADLLVLGTKGRSNLAYVLLGSTVERLLREIPCSALVLRPPTGPKAHSTSPGTEPTT